MYKKVQWLSKNYLATIYLSKSISIRNITILYHYIIYFNITKEKYLVNDYVIIGELE